MGRDIPCTEYGLEQLNLAVACQTDCMAHETHA